MTSTASPVAALVPQHGLQARDYGAPLVQRFPTYEELDRVMRGEVVAAVPSPVSDRVQKLRRLNWALISSDATPRQQIWDHIAVVVAELDQWFAFRLPRPKPGAKRSPDSVGNVLRRVAAAHAASWWELGRSTVDWGEVHRKWYRLAELSNGYRDFVVDVHAGLIELPTPRHFTRTGEVV